MTLDRLDTSASKEAAPQGQNLLSAFGSSFANSLEQPLNGLAQIRGERPQERFAVNHQATGAEKYVQEAGAIAGNAALFIGTLSMARKLPFLGRLAPLAAGAGLGFLNPTEQGEGLSTRFENAALGAGTMSLLEYGPGLLGKAGIADTAAGRIAKVGISNAGAGLASVQADSLIHTGHVAGLAETAVGTGAWMTTGLLMHGAGRAFGRTGNAEKLETPTVTEPVAGASTISLNSEGAMRSYQLYTPKGIGTDGTKVPLMVVLDGVNPKTAGTMQFESQMNRIADREGFAVAYPLAANGHKIPLAGEVHAWNSKGTGLTDHIPTYDDMNFIDNVLRDVRGRVNVDPNRVMGAGFSEGGMFLHHYQTNRPGTFAGIASIHGTMNGMEPVPIDAQGRVVRSDVVIVHSNKDYMLPYNGGRGLMTMFMPQAAESKPFMQKEFWSNVNDSRPAVVQSTPAYDQTDFVSKDGQQRVREYFVRGGQHAWDGSPAKGLPIVGRPLPGTRFDTSEKIWEFLKDARIARSLSDTVAEANARAA